MNTIRSIDSVEAIKMSLQCEIDMHAFYEKAASIVKNDDAEAILKGLAEKESKQKQQLIRAHSEVTGKKLLYLKLAKKHKLESLVKCGDDPNDAVRNAKKNEEELKTFYGTISRRLYESDLRQLFRDLAAEREQHLALLESSFVEPLHLDEEFANVEEEVLTEV